MNHVLEEILRDWAAQDAHIKMLQEELEKARITAREYLRGQENRRAECEELKHEIAAQNEAIGRLRHEINSMHAARELAQRLEAENRPSSAWPADKPATNVFNVTLSPDVQGREA